MGKKKEALVVYTITKEKFDKLSKPKQRIAVAKDVLDRIKLGQLSPRRQKFVANIETSEELEGTSQVCELLKSTDTKCEVCAKGGLFMAYIGIVNSYEKSRYASQLGNGTGHENQSCEMEMLSEVFSLKQLSLIESAFEGEKFEWNEPLTLIEKKLCRAFYTKYFTDDARLKAICKNIISNEGMFKP